MNGQPRKRVIVIGGGFAGLSTAAELSSLENVDVTLVEASDYLGGRVKQVRPFQGCQLLDVGGEFLHGEHTTAVELADKFSWQYEDIGSGSLSKTAYCFVGGKLQHLDESNQLAIQAKSLCEKFFESGRLIRRGLSSVSLRSDPLVEKLMRCDGNGDDGDDDSHDTRPNFSDLSMRDFLDKMEDVNDDCKQLIDALYCQTEGNDLDRIGMLEFSRAEDVWAYGGRNFRLKDSYNVLLEYYVQKCKEQQVDIRLNWEATAVSWSCSKPSFITNQEKETLLTDFIVVTVPLQALKCGAIKFVPNIDKYKKDTLDCMEMRNGCKIFCCFSKKFWPSNLQLLYCGVSSPFTQIWSEDSFTNDDGEIFHILCGFSTARVTEQLVKAGKENAKFKFVGQLNQIFGSVEDLHPATASFVDYYFYDWGSNPFVRGCYASPVVNSYAMAEKLAEPIENELFFAGEATNTKGMSTVQSAIDSGKRAAKEIAAILNINKKIHI